MANDKPSLNPALRDFWTKPARNRVLYGGRASSKTWDAGGIAVFLASNFKAKFLCTRQFQNRIEDSVYALLKIQIERFGLRDQFAVYNNRIECPRTGSEFLFYGRCRNIEEIKGTEGVDIHWAEECELLTKEQWNIINATVRNDGSQHWLIFNPRYTTDYTWQRFIVNPPAKTIIRKINYDENPFLSQTMRDVIEDCRLTDPDEFRHIYLGEPLADDENVIIKRKWIDAAIDAHLKLGFAAEGKRVIGFDVADSGADKCANVYAHGSVVHWADEWKAGEDELLKSAMRTYAKAQECDADVVYDTIGVGASMGAKFDELNDVHTNRILHEGFNAGGAVTNKEDDYMPGKTNADHFSNVKAQAWWMLGDRFRNTYDAITNGRAYPVDQLISISSECPMLEKLKNELSTPRRDFDNNGRVKVESKKDLDKREIPSPNLADAFVMCYAPIERKSIGFFDF